MFRTSLTSSYCSGKISPDSSEKLSKITNMHGMDINEIQSMFSEMGLATQEQREKYAEELSVSFDDSQTAGMEKKVCTNTITNLERYA